MWCGLSTDQSSTSSETSTITPSRQSRSIGTEAEVLAAGDDVHLAVEVRARSAAASPAAGRRCRWSRSAGSRRASATDSRPSPACGSRTGGSGRRAASLHPFGGQPDGRDDVLVARAAAQVAGQGLADLARRRSRAPRPAAARATSGSPACRSRTAGRGVSWKACCSGCSVPSSSARLSTVVSEWPSAWTARVRHERTGWPSICTVQAPQTPCSQPTCVPVSPASWRMKSERSRRGSMSRS